jgi:hypothetical protein
MSKMGQQKSSMIAVVLGLAVLVALHCYSIVIKTSSSFSMWHFPCSLSNEQEKE